METSKLMRNCCFDSLKIIATVLILFHHYQQVLDVRFSKINFFGGKFYFGWIVELFFIISGFVTYRYKEKILHDCIDFTSFIQRKFMRFFPMMFITAIVYCAVVIVYKRITGNVALPFGDISLWNIIITSLSVQAGGAFANPMINNPVWYISVLMICYVLFYWVTWLSKSQFTPEYLYAIVVVVGISVINYGYNLPFLNDVSARGYYAFFTGLLLAGVCNKFKAKNNKILVVCISIVLVIPVAIAKELPVGENRWIMTFIYYPALVYGSSFVFGKINGIFARAVNFLGSASFDVYMWHIILLLLIKLSAEADWVNVNLGSPVTMLAFAFIAFVWGAAVYQFVEKPINSERERRTL